MESRWEQSWLRSTLKPCASTSPSCQSGLTLVELLITITILAILAGLFLGASNAAMESARKARTKTTISKIHSLLMERWDDYATRRVDVFPRLPGAAGTQRRLLGLRRLMQLEMPDRWDDILDTGGGSFETVDSFSPADAKVTSPPSDATLITDISATIPYPAITKAYWRHYSRINSAASAKDIRSNEGAECLYMVIMLFTGDGEARTIFSQQDIGDVDSDGAPEFLDGWGRPIHFIRWPAGFVSQSELMNGDILNDGADVLEPNAFDFFRVDQVPDSPVSGRPYLADVFAGFKLLPLVYSGGPDGDPDIFTVRGPLEDDFYSKVIDDPYREYRADSITARIGSPMTKDLDDDGDNFIDNIHNHLLDGR